MGSPRVVRFKDRGSRSPYNLEKWNISVFPCLIVQIVWGEKTWYDNYKKYESSKLSKICFEKWRDHCLQNKLKKPEFLDFLTFFQKYEELERDIE